MPDQTKEALSSTLDRQQVIGKLEQFSPELVSIISECCIEKVYNRSALSTHTKEVVALVALISLGSDRIQGHFETALQEGMSLEELKEIVMLSAIYLGYPRAIDAMLQLNMIAEKLQKD